MSDLLTPRQAATVLGISYPTVKQWIYKRKLRTAQTAGGHYRIPQSEVDKFLPKELGKPGKSAAPTSVISADAIS